MRGLPIFSNEGKYQNPNAERRTFCSGILQIFRGPPKPESIPRYRDEKEKKYHHTPTHSGSSFLKTTTTAAMIPALQAQSERQQEEEPSSREHAETPSVTHQPQSLT
jgi:hypothetical protein